MNMASTARFLPSFVWTILVVAISVTLTSMSISQDQPQESRPPEPPMEVITDSPPAGAVFAMEALLDEHASRKQSYFQFLRVPDMSSGIYVLPAGAVDGQQPHDDDEIYYVLEGKAKMTIDGTEHDVSPEDVIYVRAHATHRFHTITEDLKLLVFFASTSH